MRVLFVSGTSTGGSAKSTHALACGLVRRGHHAAVLERDKTQPSVDHRYKRVTNAREHARRTPLERPLDAVARRLGARTTAVDLGTVPTWRAVHVENALPAVLGQVRPDVLVVSSISRLGWRSVRAQADRAGLPAVLYVREASSLAQLTAGNGLPDLLLANASSHAEAAEALGHACAFVPSLVDVSGTAVTSSRQVLLLVNPRVEHGVDVALAVARARPDVPVVLQESWLLDPVERAHVEAGSAGLPNVEFRPFTRDTSRMYRDARLLLVPHRMDNRPRVVLEAQANGIPVLHTDWPGLVESVGAGGVSLGREAPASAWVSAVGQLWDDAAAYERTVAAARAHADRDEVRPDRILDEVERLLGIVTGGVRP